MAFHQELNIALILRNSVSLRHWVESIEWSFQAGQTHAGWLIALAFAGAILAAVCSRLAMRGVRNILLLAPKGVNPAGAMKSNVAVAAIGGGFIGAWVGARYGLSVYALCLLLAFGLLAMLAIIDGYTGLLPDVLTMPLLWFGLVLAWVGILPVSLHESVGGVVVGYGFLWLLALAFQGLRGKEGMGQGDFKLVAALGAWLGYGFLPLVLLLACILGLLVVCASHLLKRLRCVAPAGDATILLTQTLPFGPYLAFSGVVILLVSQAR